MFITSAVRFRSSLWTPHWYISYTWCSVIGSHLVGALDVVGDSICIITAQHDDVTTSVRLIIWIKGTASLQLSHASRGRTIIFFDCCKKSYNNVRDSCRYYHDNRFQINHSSWIGKKFKGEMQINKKKIAYPNIYIHFFID